MSDDAIAHLRTDPDLAPLVEEHGPLELEPAEALLATEETTLREAGLSRQKTEFVRAAARVWREHGYDRAYFGEMTDDAVTAELTDIHGVGVWTVKIFLL